MLMFLLSFVFLLLLLLCCSLTRSLYDLNVIALLVGLNDIAQNR